LAEPAAEAAAEMIKPKITEDFQILAALASTGAGFEALGGSSLMLTEPVENGVDSIIAGRKAGLVGKGVVRIFIDRGAERVVIVDNGLGFVNPRHICEKPFDSLKKYDPDLTGKFARGLPGFRSYCDSLAFVTRRLTVPAGEQFLGKSGNTVSLEFRADRVDVGAAVAPDADFAAWSWGEFNHGAVAFYSGWKKGEFTKIRKEKLVKRIEKHFGELIRKGQIEISVWEGEGLAPGKKIAAADFYKCVPRDYSKFEKIDLPPVKYAEGGAEKGQVVFELYLTPGPKADKDYRPFLMYKDRPVGDSPVALIPEFAESTVWNSSYLTGFIRADFCEINELRLALKPGPTRDFVYQQLLNSEGTLGERIKQHHLGLIDIRKSQEINALVNKLQAFLKLKKIFDFRLAKEAGTLSTGDASDTLTGSSAPGEDTTRAFPSAGGQPVIGATPIVVGVQDNVLPGNEQGVFQSQTDFGGAGGDHAKGLDGGPGEPGATGGFGKDGYRENAGDLNKSKTEQQTAATGDAAAPNGKKFKHRKPRGFNITTAENEFSEELSAFDPLTSTIIVNSAHARYKARDKTEDPLNKELLAYLAELYIWEICKLAGQQSQDFPVMDTFLSTKYEFFETS
jgi:hypothetical protein